MALPQRTQAGARLLLPGACLALLGLNAAAPLAAQGVYSLITEQSRTAFTIQGAGARAVGTGGAFIAVADDGTAVSYNPAGLAQLLCPELSVTAQTYSRDLTFTGFSSSNPLNPTTQEDSGVTDHHTRPSFFSFSIPWKRDGLNNAVQFSYQRILDFDFSANQAYTAAPTGGGALQNISQGITQSGGIDLYSLALGSELSSRLLVGASLNVWSGSWSFSSASSNVTGGTPVYDSTLAQNNQFRGVNGNLGIIWRSEYLNLGAVYRMPFTATYTFENYQVQPDPVTGLIVTTHGDRTAYAMHWPATFGWGLGAHPTPTLLLAADWSYTPWSSTNFVAAGTPYDNLNFFDMATTTRTPDVTTFNTGAEWVALVGDAWALPVRCGWFREPQPIVDPNTGQQRILLGWTAGLGLKWNSTTIDLAYKETRSTRYVSRLNTDAQVGGVESYGYGTEHLEERRAYLSVLFQLDPERIHRALAWMLVGN